MFTPKKEVSKFVLQCLVDCLIDTLLFAHSVVLLVLSIHNLFYFEGSKIVGIALGAVSLIVLYAVTDLLYQRHNNIDTEESQE